MKYVIRLWGMEISNIKNVIHGEIEMPQNKKGSILGIYGANGSGKTVVVDCMVLLKYLLSGRQIPSNFYYYINEASNTSSVKYRFELKIEEKCYLVEYEIANYAQTECQFRYCGTAIPFLTVRSTAR